MHQEEIIQQHVHDLKQKHGEAGAFSAAENHMREEMDKGDVKNAGIWLSVMYELTRAEAEG